MEKLIYDRYIVTSEGEVFSLSQTGKRRKLKAYKKENGRNQLYVLLDKRHKSLGKLVYESFVRDLEANEVIKYIDNDYDN